MATGGVDLGPVFQAAGQEWNVDPMLLQAVAGQESGGTANPDQALSPKGAQGRMQLMPGTAWDMGVRDTSDPVQNIYGGAKYLSQQLDKYGMPELALAAYNAGPGRVDDYLAGKAGLPAETVAYVPGIGAKYRALGGGQQQATPDPSATPAALSLDDAATANLDSRMAQLRAGGGQPASAPSASLSAPSPAPALGLTDYFSQAKVAAFAASGGAAPGAQPAATPTQTPAGGQSSAMVPGGPVDYFSMAKAAAQAATANAPGASGGSAGPVIPASLPGAAQPAPAGQSAASGIMGTIGSAAGTAANAVGQQAANFAEGAGHAVLGASRALYGAIDYGNRVGPAALAPDGSLIDRAINPAAAIPNLDAESAKYAASGVGDTLAGKAGDLAGQTVLTLPVLAASGVGTAAAIAGRGIAAGADAISPALGAAARGTGNLLMGTASVPDNALLNAAVRPVSLAANGAAQGAVAGALTGDPNSTFGHNLLTGAAAGAIAGPAAVVAGRVVGGATNALTGIGGQVDPEIAALARTARDTYGIPITAPQLSENSLVRIANDQSSKLPFSGAGAVHEAQQTAFNRAVAGTFGEMADRVTPDVMDRAATRIGGVFNDIARRTNIQADPQLLSDLARIGTSARNVLPAAEQIPINRQIMNVLDAAQTGRGQISGNAYQAITGSGADLAQTMRAPDARVGDYASQVRDALDAAFQRSAAPGDRAALTTARQQWRAMKTIEDSVEKGSAGNIAPASLMGQVRAASSRFDSSTGGMAYTGGGPLGDLAKIGQQFLKPPPNSGTPDRMLVNSLLGGGAVAGGAVNPVSLAAVPAGLLANRLTGSYLRSGFYTNNLLNSTLGTLGLGNSLMNAGRQVQALAPLAASVGASPMNKLMQY